MIIGELTGIKYQYNHGLFIATRLTRDWDECKHALMQTRIDWIRRNFLETSSSSMRNASILELIISAKPSNLTLRTEPRMEVVKLIRFSVARSHSFCRVETALPVAKEEAMNTNLNLSDNGKDGVLVGEMDRTNLSLPKLERYKPHRPGFLATM